MDAIEMVKKFFQFFFTMAPNCKSVIHVLEPDCGCEGCQSQGLFFEMFHVEVCYNWAEGAPHGHSICLFIQLISPLKLAGR